MSTPLIVTTAIHAPLEKVWQLWTDPAHITQWNAASPDWHTPSAENDLRQGGSFSYHMAAKDGSFAFDFGGMYDDVKPHQLIAYTIGDGRKVEVTFSVEGTVTIVTERFDPEQINPPEMQQAGWQAILDSFRRYVESMA